jgi:site-specific DNA-methyltransferase (adenine-specific)
MIDLRNGDCIEVLKTIPDSLVDAVICDPPYGTTRCKWDSIIPLDEMWQQIERVLKPKGVVVLFAQTPFDKILGASNLDMLRYEWIWEKTAATGHLNAKKMPMKAHENILVFYKQLPTYNAQKTTGHPPTNSYTKRKGDGECYGKTVEVSGGGATDRYPRDVIVFPSDKQKLRLHPTQKPLMLLEYLIRTYTNENDVVLDFAMGSGTTGVACKKLNRAFVGIELEKDIFETAENRILSV